MSPLSAAATRTALADTALNPQRSHRGVIVPVAINLAQGLQFNVNAVNASGTLRSALRDCFGAGTVLGIQGDQLVSPANQRGAWKLLFVSPSRAADYGANHHPADYVTNKNFVTDDAGWTDVVGGVMARSTAQQLHGAASGLLAMLAANDGAYFLAAATPLTQAVAYRASFWYRTSNAAGTFRGYIEERNAADSSQVGKTNGATLTPTTSWQFATFNRTCAAGNRLRMGFEQVGAVACDVHVSGICLAAQANSMQLYGANLVNVASGLFDAGEVLNLLLKFDGVTYDPLLLYDALNAHFGTVATDKDTLSRDTLDLTLAT